MPEDLGSPPSLGTIVAPNPTSPRGLGILPPAWAGWHRNPALHRKGPVSPLPPSLAQRHGRIISAGRAHGPAPSSGPPEGRPRLQPRYLRMPLKALATWHIYLNLPRECWNSCPQLLPVGMAISLPTGRALGYYGDRVRKAVSRLSISRRKVVSWVVDGHQLRSDGHQL